MTGSPNNPDLAGSDADSDFARLLDDYLILDTNRFHRRVARVRAEAGPSLMGGPRGIDLWTYDYVRRQVDDCLRDVAGLVLDYAMDAGVEPASLIDATRTALKAHFQSMFTELQSDQTSRSAYDYDVRPAPQALAEVRQFAQRRLEDMLRSLARGRIDERLRLRRGLFTRLLDTIGSGRKAVFWLAVLLFLIAVWSQL